MSKKINDIIVRGDIIYLKTVEDKTRKTISINLREFGLYENNEKVVTSQILKYAIKNDYEFDCNNSITKPYFLTIKNINEQGDNKEYIISDVTLLDFEYRNAVAELNIQFQDIKEYLYNHTEIKLDEYGKVDKEGIYIPIQFKEIKSSFNQPLKININEYGEAIREISDEICRCRYVIAENGKRYIVLANEKELEEKIKIEVKQDSEYLKLIAERNECFSKCSGIDEIYCINNNFCIDDSYIECSSYDIRKELIKYLQQEFINKIYDLNKGEEER